MVKTEYVIPIGMPRNSGRYPWPRDDTDGVHFIREHPGRCNGKVYFKELAERALQAEEARIEHERLAAMPMDISKNDKKNEEGYFDMTAYKAMADKPTANENERFRKLLHTIFHLCELAGFELVGRITVRDRKTNRIWK